MRNLYPEIDPNHSFQINVDTIHEIYFEESGNPSGIPVLFVHGGPGTGSNENHRRYFDPSLYRIINFDQRGCNRSSPGGEINNNTTQDLLADMELIRSHLKIEKWLIFGGSWGSTLGLLYAQKTPDNVLGMILRGTFLAREQDIQWFVGNGVNRIFPDAWERFLSILDTDEHDNIVNAYYKRLTHPDRSVVEQAARHWSDWSGTIVTYLLNFDEYVPPEDISDVINEITIEAHYGSHNYFIRENQILTDIGNVPAVPILLIHGRRDLTCTVDASWDIHKALPGSELTIVKEGGHLAGEPVMTDALIKATDEMVRRLG